MTFLLTVTTQVPTFPPAEAVMFEAPSAIAVTTPDLSTVATDCFEEAQITSLSVALLGVIVADNLTVSPTIISAVGWLIVTDDTATSCSC